MFTFPESQETLSLQLKSLKEGNIDTVLIPSGTPLPNIPSKSKLTNTKVGKWIYNPESIDSQTIKDMVKDGTYGELLGHVEPKSDKANQIVVAKINGVEAKSSMVSPENVERQSNILKQQFPDAVIESGGKDKINEVLKQREDAMKMMIKIKPAKHKMTDEERIKEMTDMMHGKMPKDEEAEADAEHDMEENDENEEQLLHGMGKNNYELSKKDAEGMDKNVEEMEQDEEDETSEEEDMESPEYQKREEELGIEKHKNRLFSHPKMSILISMSKSRKG